MPEKLAIEKSSGLFEKKFYYIDTWITLATSKILLRKKIFS